MKEFTITIDYANYYGDYNELINYMKSLDGIKDINIVENTIITVDIKYDEKIINDEIIKGELLSFLKLSNRPVIYGFDKHAKKDIVTLKLKCKYCCESCFGNIIYKLIDTPGIMRVKTDIYEKIYTDDARETDEYNIEIQYDPEIITNDKLDEIKKHISIYG